MHEVPAAWYDDPEDPSQYRYWDGSQWTDHRAPKHLPAPPRGRQGVLKDTWFLGTQSVGPLIGIAALYFLALMPFAILVVVGAAQSIDPSLGDIIERMTAEDWNPDVDPADQEFQDSIRFAPSAFFWVSAVIAVAAMLPITVLAYSMSMVLMANRYKGGSMQFGDAWTVGIKHFRRNLGVAIVWGVCWLTVAAILVGGWALALFVSPLFFVPVVPVTIGLIVYGYPFLWLALTSLYVGPRDRPPWRSLVALVKPQWSTVAGPVLIVNLVLVGLNLAATVLGLIPILGLVVGLAGSVAQWIGQYGSAIVIWDDVGGEFDTDVLESAAS